MFRLDEHIGDPQNAIIGRCPASAAALTIDREMEIIRELAGMLEGYYPAILTAIERIAELDWYVAAIIGLTGVYLP